MPYKNPEDRKEQDSKRQSMLKYRLSHVQSGAKKRKIPYALDYEWALTLPLVCYYTGMKLTLNPNKNHTVSFERIDSNKGYTKDNVVLCCTFINWAKGKMPEKQFIKMCKDVSDHQARKRR